MTMTVGIRPQTSICRRDKILSLLLMIWLTAPTLALALIRSAERLDIGLELRAGGLALCIFLLPVAVFRKIRSFFFFWTPVALFVPIVIYLTYLFKSTPSDGLLSAAVTTNPKEAIEVISAFGWRAPLILSGGALYAVACLFIQKDASIGTEKRKFIVCVALCYIMVGLNSYLLQTYFWKARPLIAESDANTVFPASLAMSAFRVLHETVQHEQEVRVDARLMPPTPEHELIVLVIGESVISEHLGVNGYHRQTTPKLASLGDSLISFTDVASTDTRTFRAVPALLTRHIGGGTASIVDAFREAGFKTAWFSNQDRDVFHPSADVADFTEQGPEAHYRQDGELLPLMQAFIKQSGPRQFIVLHMYGSHFPYDRRYTVDSKIFVPTLADIGSPVPDKSVSDETINSYDNTIVQMDHFLSEVILALKELNTPAVMLFTSDHGEGLFEKDQDAFMHGIGPRVVKAEVHVPLLIWANSAYSSAEPEKMRALTANRNLKTSHRAVFPSLLDLSRIEFKGANSAEFLDSPYFRPETNRQVTTVAAPGAIFNYDELP